MSHFRKERENPSLQESYRTIPINQASWWSKLRSFLGPGYLVAVGYVDPGNWATDLAGGSKFGYTLLCIILLSNLIAILLQHLSAKLGVVTGRDLAQACHDNYSKPVSFILWILGEIAITACDLAEVIGSAIALNLLFGMPLLWGVLITAFDVLLLTYLQKFGFRYLEAFVISLMVTIGLCFWMEILFSHPDLYAIFRGLIPTPEIILNPDMLYISIGIIGATVMPHNLYLHSALVQTRNFVPDEQGKKEAIKFFSIDSAIALMYAFLINAAILIVAASVFHKSGHTEVAEIQDAYLLLTPIVNVSIASTLFAVALLAAGQNSTLTGTLAGQVIMEGFLNLRIRPWVRRLLTRLAAIVPAVICIIYYGESGLTELLIFSQVILSLQLSFALIPLVIFTGDKQKMGQFVNPLWIKCLAWIAAALIVILNVKYVIDFIGNHV